jgi:RND superfamily putative drug exporter
MISARDGFARLAGFDRVHAKAILAVTALLVAASAVLGGQAFAKLKTGGFASAHAPSQVATKILAADFAGAPNLIFLVRARAGNVDAAAVADVGTSLTSQLTGESGVRGVISYWTTHDPALRSRTGGEALVLATVYGPDSYVISRSKVLAGKFVGTSGAATVTAGGSAYVYNVIGDQINSDLTKAESVALPIVLLLLILAFGSVVAATMPVLIGLFSIVTTLAALFVIGSITDVQQSALNLATSIGLGLAIDYSLLLVNRHREEMAQGKDVAEALAAAIATAGRTIMFSALTVVAAMTALLVFPAYFLRSMAYTGITVVLMAAVGALVVLPAVLALLGPRVNAGRVRIGRRRGAGLLTGAESPFWRRFVAFVWRHPLVTAVPVLAALIVMALPLARVHFGSPDDRTLQAGSVGRQVGDQLRTNFSGDILNTADVVTSQRLFEGDAARFKDQIVRVPGVVSARVVQSPQSTWVAAVLRPDPFSTQAADVVGAVRRIAAPNGVASYVGGQAATLVDQEHDLGSRLPLALCLTALMTVIVLWLFTGSVLIPIKALALNGLVLAAVLGMSVWIFQEGHLSSVLGFSAAPTSTTMPLLLFCIAFGLSMDYEVFVLSRIKELRDAGASDRDAVVGGLAKTGRIVTTAATLMSITFLAFAVSKVSFMQMFAISTGLAVLIDAFLVRTVLVPAFMRIGGRAIWWSPRLLMRLRPQPVSVSNRDLVDQNY